MRWARCLRTRSRAPRRPRTEASTPRRPSKRVIVCTSRRFGTLRKTCSPSASSAAVMIGSAAFFAPLTGTVPDERSAPDDFDRIHAALLPRGSRSGNFRRESRPNDERGEASERADHTAHAPRDIGDCGPRWSTEAVETNGSMRRTSEASQEKKPSTRSVPPRGSGAISSIEQRSIATSRRPHRTASRAISFFARAPRRGLDDEYRVRVDAIPPTMERQASKRPLDRIQPLAHCARSLRDPIRPPLRASRIPGSHHRSVRR